MHTRVTSHADRPRSTSSELKWLHIFYVEWGLRHHRDDRGTPPDSGNPAGQRSVHLDTGEIDGEQPSQKVSGRGSPRSSQLRHRPGPTVAERHGLPCRTDWRIEPD
ncbi:hypothetical protein MPRF_47130 [Mycolicibacterium parafortuitum]|uniref:Uncharacterized protein n=1 Tax=Mycolicibacterium parafortuitum TaxID=39692 RepID=A0A7I7U8R9_MYCPF|nr:hypothetical protein MPRF_47130 [Mycolicibacterium parafortuitum]